MRKVSEILRRVEYKPNCAGPRRRPPHTDMDFFKGCALAGTLGCLGLLALSLAPAAIMVLGHLMN